MRKSNEMKVAEQRFAEQEGAQHRVDGQEQLSHSE